MKIFNFFKKKKTIQNNDINILKNDFQEEDKEDKIEIMEKESTVHPFSERCEFLKKEYGLIVPDVYQKLFTYFNIEKNNSLYHPFWIEGEPYVEIFYTEKFVLYMIERYLELYDKDFDQEKFQEIIEYGKFEFILKENRFEAQHVDIAFVDQCYEELGRNQDYLIIGLNIYATCGGAEFLILSSDKKGYYAGCYHGMETEIEHQGIKINYDILDHYRSVNEEIGSIFK